MQKKPEASGARKPPAGTDYVLLSNARVLSDVGKYEEAARALRRALELHPKYPFFPRAEKLTAALAGQVTSWTRRCRIAVLGASTTNLLVPVLHALAFRDRIRAEIYEGQYGSMQQEILDPSSGLSRFRPDIAFLIASWHDLHLPPVVADEDAFVANVVDQFRPLWERLSMEFGCHVVQFGFDYPADESYGYLGRSLRGGRTRVVTLLNLRLHEAVPSYVSVLEPTALQRDTGQTRWNDPVMWYSFRQHPSPESLPVLAEAMMAHVRSVLGLTRKVLVTDLDNTLWKGVIGEDGLDGIQIGPGSPGGEACARLQQYLLDLKSRGVLLAVASKNNPEDARLPFERHPQMLLRLPDFAAFEANWNDKADSLRTISEKLGLGLDSFVFLDDNPMEQEWIRSQCADVAVVDGGPNVSQLLQALDHGRYFYALSLSPEDQARADQYRTEAAREELRTSAQTLDDFLAGLELSASAAPVTEANIARVVQLLNKTNQFNLTARRYTEAQVRSLANDPEAWTAAFRLSDRLGDYGLIGVLFCVPAGEGRRWEVDTWLMSCRSLGRQMERFMFDRMVESAQAQSVREIVGVYRATQKNSLAGGLYAQLGFTKLSETPEETRWSYLVPSHPVMTAAHVRNESLAGVAG